MNTQASNIVTSRELLIARRTQGQRTPGKRIKEGSVVVRVFPVTEAGRPTRYEVRYFAGGKRIRKKFPARAEAEAFAKEQAAALNHGRHIGRGLTTEQAAFTVSVIERCEAHEKRTGDSRFPIVILDEALAEKERAHQIGVTVKAALDHWVATNPSALHTRTVPAAVAEFLAEIEARAKRQKSSGCNWRNLRARLNAFAKSFEGSLASVRPPAVQAWLKALPFEPKTLNHYRAAIVELMRFSKTQGWCHRDLAESIAEIPRYDLLARDATPHTADELRKLLDYAQRDAPKHLPMIVLVALCGLRVCEVASEKGHFDWTDIDFERGEIRVRKELAKKRQERYAHFPPAAVAWLRLVAKPSGPVCPVDRASEAFKRLCVNAGVPKKKNGLRSGFISHRVDLTNDLKLTAREAGTSVDRIESNYFKLRAKGEPEAWFNTHPCEVQLQLLSPVASPNRPQAKAPSAKAH